jgi:hypothetical protein
MLLALPPHADAAKRGRDGDEDGGRVSSSPKIPGGVRLRIAEAA